MEILWWHWLVLGLVLAAAEMASAGGFYIIFFGIGAMVVGILSALGLAGPVWMQTFLFSAISIASLALFRTRLLKMMQPDPQAPSVDALVGEVAIATEDVAAGSIGKVELRGAQRRCRDRDSRHPVPRDGCGRSYVARGARRSPLMEFNPLTIVGLIFIFVALIIIAKTAVVVPQQSAFVVERLGRFSGVLSAGFHFLIPFFDVIRYRHSLKEVAIDIPAQVCITRDNVQVGVDGILYIKVMNPERASYGIADYIFAIVQLAQTNLRSEIGKIDLDKTFEERIHINMQVVQELDKASEAWGVKVLRYEIKNITPPHDVLAAMEKQMRAEREKRAVILTSEGSRDAAINTAEGEKQQVIKASEARRQQQINEAEGQASAILAVATATGEGIRKVADAIRQPGGMEATQLRVAENYIIQFGELAKKTNTMILPANVADTASMVATAMRVFQQTSQQPPPK
jgi:regulator of protease activity HflC (stomatin/prohibitin superfamily)/membrane protein implicated in regulation of membrane protease activity